MKKRFLAIFLAMALCVGIATPAYATCSWWWHDNPENYVFYPVAGGNIAFALKNPYQLETADGQYYNVSAWDGDTITAVNIPGSINGVPVRCISYKGFYNCKNLKSVILSEGLTSWVSVHFMTAPA